MLRLHPPPTVSYFPSSCLVAIDRNRNDELDMRGMDEDDLVTVCALSGCDYLPSVPGVGLKKAYRLVKRHKQVSTYRIAIIGTNFST